MRVTTSVRTLAMDHRPVAGDLCVAVLCAARARRVLLSRARAAGASGVARSRRSRPGFAFADGRPDRGRAAAQWRFDHRERRRHDDRASSVNGISITFEDKGPRDAPVILLVMGLAVDAAGPTNLSMRWECARRTIRYDNRDVGLSTRFDAAGVPNLKWMFVKSLLRLPVRSAYTLADMAADGVALLDHLGIARAHIVGVSMGGMISHAYRRALSGSRAVADVGDVDDRQLPACRARRRKRCRC